MRSIWTDFGRERHYCLCNTVIKMIQQMHINELFPQVFYSALIMTFLVLLHNYCQKLRSDSLLEASEMDLDLLWWRKEKV